MEFIIGKSEVEAFLILLFNLEEYEACEKVLEVYEKYFITPDESYIKALH